MSKGLARGEALPELVRRLKADSDRTGAQARADWTPASAQLARQADPHA